MTSRNENEIHEVNRNLSKEELVKESKAQKEKILELEGIIYTKLNSTGLPVIQAELTTNPLTSDASTPCIVPTYMGPPLEVLQKATIDNNELLQMNLVNEKLAEITDRLETFFDAKKKSNPPIEDYLLRLEKVTDKIIDLFRSIPHKPRPN